MLASFPALGAGTAVYLMAHSVGGATPWLGVVLALAGVAAFSAWAPATALAYHQALGALFDASDEQRRR